MATQSPSASSARQLSSWQCVLGGCYVGKQFFCFRMSQYMLESMFPSMNRISPVPAVVMQPQTMMLPTPCLTVGKAQFSWYFSPERRHTCWTPSESNKFTLDSSDHRTWFQSFVLLARLYSANCFVSQLQKRLPSGMIQTDLLDCVCGVWSEL